MVMSGSNDFNTLCIRGGITADPAFGAVLPPIYQSTTFRYETVGEDQAFSYSRAENPTVGCLEARLGDLENSLPAVSFSTGMAAVSTLLLAVLKSGDHVVCSDVVYGGTYRFLKEILENLGVESDFVDASDPENVIRAYRPQTRLLFLESPANPTLKLCDIQALATSARERGVLSVVDNTFLTPVLQRPLDLGADYSLYSTTKYIDGHNATVGGAVCTRDAGRREKLADVRKCLGTIQTPHSAWLTLQGLKTLPLRLERQTRSALQVAEALEKIEAISTVRHPDLPSFPQKELRHQQQGAGGGLVTFELKGGFAAAVKVLGTLKLCTPAENLGAVETLVTHNASMTHAAVPEERRLALGITDGLLRLSVGLEDPREIIADLDQAIATATKEVDHV
jgi:cystathionine beta-lyase/cystathionine gamma-synthase